MNDINLINLDEFKEDYNNCMLADDMMVKYNINRYYFKKLRKILNLNRGMIDKLDYICKINNVVKPIKSVAVPIKPVAVPKKSVAVPKTNINIKLINTDDEVNITEIKKCDTTQDKTELMNILKNADVAISKSKKTLNKNNVL